MPQLVLDDGLTLTGATAAAYGINRETDAPLYAGLPVVAVTYRPALWDTQEAWRQAQGSSRGAEATLKLLRDHLVSWDVLLSNGQGAPLDDRHLRLVHPAIQAQLVELVLSWEPRAAGNG